MTRTVGWKKRKEFEGSDIVCIVVEAESRGVEHIFFYGDLEALVNACESTTSSQNVPRHPTLAATASFTNTT